MSQTPSATVRSFPVNVGPGGIIPDTPENRPFLQLVDSTPALSPRELYTLAVSYQRVDSNIGLGDRLAFIALCAIFEYPPIQKYLSTSSLPLVQQHVSEQSFCDWPCAIGVRAPGCPPCPTGPSTSEVKRVFLAGLQLLVEVLRVNERKTYAFLGVSPSKLEVSLIAETSLGGSPSGHEGPSTAETSPGTAN